MNPLSIPFNAAVRHICDKVLPRGFDVSSDAPSTLESLIAHYDATGRVLVWNGASDQTIFACAETNFAFRAWHDSKHILHNLPFDRAGEYDAMLYQCDDVNRIYDGEMARDFVEILYCEIIGQFDYQKHHGGFPIDQIGFARAMISNRANPGITPCPIWASIPQFGISPES